MLYASFCRIFNARHHQIDQMLLLLVLLLHPCMVQQLQLAENAGREKHPVVLGATGFPPDALCGCLASSIPAVKDINCRLQVCHAPPCTCTSGQPTERVDCCNASCYLSHMRRKGWMLVDDVARLCALCLLGWNNLAVGQHPLHAFSCAEPFWRILRCVGVQQPQIGMSGGK